MHEQIIVIKLSSVSAEALNRALGVTSVSKYSEGDTVGYFVAVRKLDEALRKGAIKQKQYNGAIVSVRKSQVAFFFNEPYAASCFTQTVANLVAAYYEAKIFMEKEGLAVDVDEHILTNVFRPFWSSYSHTQELFSHLHVMGDAVAELNIPGCLGTGNRLRWAVTEVQSEIGMK